MDILINGKAADITLDTEKTLGDVLTGIELWISPTGNRINGITLDGKPILDNLAEVSPQAVREIKKLEIFVTPWRELAAEALISLLETCNRYGNAAFEDRPQIAAGWEKSAAARFSKSDISDIAFLAERTLSGEGLSPGELSLLIDERLREIYDPGRETLSARPLVEAIVQRMEELPLDIQTGKDQRAAETVQLFSRMGEKLFRIFFLLESEGLSPDTFIIDSVPAQSFINDFNSALKELSAAYENRDIVLAGDIAEYELAPRLFKFFSALKELAESDSALMPES